MGKLSKDQIDKFNEEGFIQLKGLFDIEEIEMLRSTARADRELDKHSFSRADGEGERSVCPFGIIPAIPSMVCLHDPTRW